MARTCSLPLVRMNSDLDRRLRDCARNQHDVISRAQARGLGGHRRQIAVLITLGLWEEVTGRVLRRTGSRRTFRQRCMIAVLDTGGIICGETALALWAVPGFAHRPPIRIARLRGSSNRECLLPGVVILETRVLPANQCLRLDGIPIVSPARAIYDIAYWHNWDKVKRALTNAWSMGITSGKRIHDIGKTWLKRGRAGTVAMRQLLQVRPIDYVPPASNLEARFLDILEKNGEPLPERQVDLGDEVSWIGRVDCLCTDMPLVVEIQSDRFHVAPLDADADERRFAALRSAGFEILELTEHEVWHDQAEVLRKWREARTNCQESRATRVRDLPGRTESEAG
jgi:very-short-patch-repair endonuclease